MVRDMFPGPLLSEGGVSSRSPDGLKRFERKPEGLSTPTRFRAILPWVRLMKANKTLRLRGLSCVLHGRRASGHAPRPGHRSVVVAREPPSGRRPEQAAGKS